MEGEEENSPGVEVWTELKVIRHGKFQEPLKKEQSAWLRKHWRAGGRCYVLAQCENNDIMMWSGDRARLLHAAPGDAPIREEVPPNLVFENAYSTCAYNMLNRRAAQPSDRPMIRIDGETEKFHWVGARR
jgi:hypothetical protein